MKVSDFAVPTTEQHSDVPEEIRRYAEPTHGQVSTLTQVVQGHLGIENFNAERREIEFEHDVVKVIALQVVRGMPKKVEVEWEATFGYYRHTWRVIDGSTVEVKVKWDVDPGAPKLVRLWIEGE